MSLHASTRYPAVSNPLPRDVAQLRSRMVRAVAWASPAWMRDHRDDIVQTAMMRLLGIMERRGRAWECNEAYLRRLARCTTLNAIRRLHPGCEIPDPTAASRAVCHSDPASKLARKRISEAIGRGIEQLSPSRRDAVTLYLEGHRLKEIASAMQCDPKRAENLVYRGLAQLRRHLARHGLRPRPTS